MKVIHQGKVHHVSIHPKSHLRSLVRILAFLVLFFAIFVLPSAIHSLSHTRDHHPQSPSTGYGKDFNPCTTYIPGTHIPIANSRDSIYQDWKC